MDETMEPREVEVEIAVDAVHLRGDLRVPADARAVVLFAHGSGSSRRSPRNRAVARALESRGLATLLFDLLTPDEESDRSNVFDVEMLAGRLGAAARWLVAHETGSVPLGYFGASTGAAAALIAAARGDPTIDAVVSRGGRVDMASGWLGRVRAPTLVIVGGDDSAVLELTYAVMGELTCPHRLVEVPGATHLFEEPGALERVADLAGAWFLQYLLGEGES